MAQRQMSGRNLNNRIEGSHQRMRRRERAMQRFRRTRSLQKFASVYNHFNQERHLYGRQAFKVRRWSGVNSALPDRTKRPVMPT
jgi:putative transposase